VDVSAWVQDCVVWPAGASGSRVEAAVPPAAPERKALHRNDEAVGFSVVPIALVIVVPRRGNDRVDREVSRL